MRSSRREVIVAGSVVGSINLKELIWRDLSVLLPSWRTRGALATGAIRDSTKTLIEMAPRFSPYVLCAYKC
jgi:hypothetical protein